MVDPIDDIVCRSSVSGTVIDSIIMEIVDSVKELEVRRLNERLGFVEQEMQKLEGCLRMKQEALDEDMISLMYSSDSVWERLEEAELLILKKNRELAAAMNRESALREAMEIKDKEISSMMVLLELSNFDDPDDDNGDNGDLGKLKEEVSLQLGNIMHEVDIRGIRLIEGMRDICGSRIGRNLGFTNATSETASEHEMLINESTSFFPYETSIGGVIELQDDVLLSTRLHDHDPDAHNSSLVNLQKVFYKLSEKNVVLTQMLDVLQRTLDVLFLKTRKAISMSKMDLLDQRWEHIVQSQVSSIVLQCFTGDLQKDYESKCKTSNEYIGLTSDRWLLAKEAISRVRDELNEWASQQEEPPRNHVILRTRSSPSPYVGSIPTMKEDQYTKSLLKNHVSDQSLVDTSSRNNGVVVPRTEDMGSTDEFSEKSVQSPRRPVHSVAAMIRNHESIIRRKMEETQCYKGDPLKDKGPSPLRKEILSDATKKKIINAALKLDSIIMENPMSCTNQSVGTSHNVLPKEKIARTQSLGNSDSVSMNFLREEKLFKKERLQYDMEEANMKRMIKEQVFALLFLEHFNQFNLQVQEHAILSLMKDDIVGLVVRDVLMNWNGNNDLLTKITSSRSNYVKNMSIRSCEKTSSEEIRELQEVSEDAESQVMVMKDVLLLLLGEYIKGIHCYIDSDFALSLLRNDIFIFILGQTFMVPNHEKDSCIIQELDYPIKDSIFSSQSDHSKHYGAGKFLPEGADAKGIHEEEKNSCLEVVDNFSDVIYTPNNTNLSKAIRTTNQGEDAHIPIIMMKEIMAVLIRGYVEGINLHAEDDNVLNFMREYIFKLSLREMLKDWVNQKNSHNASESDNYINGRILNSRTASTVDYKRYLCIYNYPQDIISHIIVQAKDSDDPSLLTPPFHTSASSVPIDYASRKIKLREEIDEPKEDLIESSIHTMMVKEVFVVLLKEYMIQLHLQMEDHVICSFMKDDILKLIFGRVLMNLHDEKDCCSIGSFVLEDLYLTFLSEAVNNMHLVDDNGSSTMCKPENKYSTAVKFLPISGNHESEANMMDDETCEEILTSLLKSIERNHMMAEYGTNSIEEEANFRPISFKDAEFNDEDIPYVDIWAENEDTLNKLHIRLGKALEQILWNRAELKELQSGLDISTVYYKQDVSSTITKDVAQMSFACTDDEGKMRKSLESMVASTLNLSQVFIDLEQLVCEKLSLVILRLDELKRLFDPLAHQAKSLRDQQHIYGKAFIRRCYNLQSAEVEVDLLADEVDILLGLLEKVYLVLDHHSPVLQHYAGVMDVMKLIRRELTRVITPV